MRVCVCVTCVCVCVLAFPQRYLNTYDNTIYTECSQTDVMTRSLALRPNEQEKYSTYSYDNVFACDFSSVVCNYISSVNIFKRRNHKQAKRKEKSFVQIILRRWQIYYKFCYSQDTRTNFANQCHSSFTGRTRFTLNCISFTRRTRVSFDNTYLLCNGGGLDAKMTQTIPDIVHRIFRFESERGAQNYTRMRNVQQRVRREFNRMEAPSKGIPLSNKVPFTLNHRGLQVQVVSALWRIDRP